jgi:translation initiation factor IF-1
MLASCTPTPVQVKLPSGEQTLCVLPNKFNKKLWIKRGGYLIVQHGDVDPQHSVTGTITSVLYEQDIRHLKSLKGVWWVAVHELLGP